MGLDLLLEAVNEGEYDPDCARIETALRAVWLLYRRDKWNLLGEMGLDKATYFPLFQEFDDRHLGESSRIRNDRQTLQFVVFIRQQGSPVVIRLLSAALWMVGEYMTRRRRIRASYYGQGDNNE